MEDEGREEEGRAKEEEDGKDEGLSSEEESRHAPKTLVDRFCADARRAKVAGVQRGLYTLIRGAFWKSGGPLKELESKLRKSPLLGLTSTEWRTCCGDAKAAGAPLRHRFDRRTVMANGCATRRKMTEAARRMRNRESLNLMERQGGRRKRHRGKQKK